jgi:holo-[acyl-carrier protein] synthase
MKQAGVGIDITEIVRFTVLLKKKNRTALERWFTAQERGYCELFKDSAPHFAGIFAAKEAASKALGTEKYPFISLEIRHKKNGAPEVWQKGRRLPVKVSITHSAGVAAAVAVM